MAIAQINTSLSLDRWAHILGINPVHFNGGFSDPVFPNNYCSGSWMQYSWQDLNGAASREEVAQAISSAEWEIQRVLGYYVTPKLIENEVHVLKDKQEYVSLHHRGVKSFVQKQSTFLANLPVVYSDADGDGYTETASVTLTNFNTSWNTKEIKPFFPGYAGAARYQIRHAIKRTLTNTTLVISMPSWLLIEPSVWERHPTREGFIPVNANNQNILVDTLDLYRVSFVPSTITIGSQTFTPTILDHKSSFVSLKPANVNCTTAQPISASFSYFVGEQDELFEDEVPQFWAETICWLSVARLTKPSCTCSSMVPIWQELQKNFAMREGGQTLDFNDIANPFGTRGGELKAWHRVSMYGLGNIGGIN